MPESVPVDVRMRRYAAGFVREATARNRLPLDYSVDSLRVVDVIVDGLRKGGRDRDGVRSVLFGLGVYTGEVLVRRTGAQWFEFDAEQRELFEQPVGVRMPDGRLWNPLGKVVKRFEAGGEESTLGFYLLMQGRLAAVPEPRRPERPSRETVRAVRPGGV